MPPIGSDYAQWDVSTRLRKDIDHANKVFYGRKGAHWEMKKHRICWYVIAELKTNEGVTDL